MIKSEYLQEIFKEFPVLMVDDFSEVTEDLLKENDHLFQEAQKIDLKKLDIKLFFDKIIDETDTIFIDKKL